MTVAEEMKIPEQDFEPKIVGFLCKWCTYQAADLAGTSRLKFSPNITTVRIPCTGRLDPSFVFRAFSDGADGVFIGGCHPGDCHYGTGNYNAMKRIPIIRAALKQFGIESKRARLEWVSGAEAQRFADFVDEFTDQIRSLGPVSWNKHSRKLKEVK